MNTQRAKIFSSKIASSKHLRGSEEMALNDKYTSVGIN